MYHTCIGYGGIFVQGHQWRVKQHNVGVFSDHPMVRCLNPRLVFIHCGKKAKCEMLTIILYWIYFRMTNSPQVNKFTYRDKCSILEQQHMHHSPLGKAPPVAFYWRHAHFANLSWFLFSPPLSLSSFKPFLQVLKHSSILDQWSPLCCQQKNASTAKSKQSAWAEGLIKFHNWVTGPWAVCDTTLTHFLFVYHLGQKRMK